MSGSETAEAGPGWCDEHNEPTCAKCAAQAVRRPKDNGPGVCMVALCGMPRYRHPKTGFHTLSCAHHVFERLMAFAAQEDEEP